MQNQAYTILDAIDRGVVGELPTHGGWVEAVQTIRWATRTDQGLALTTAGRHALDDFARKRRHQH